MKLLHTSDWHLGRMLYNRKRYDESEAFLDWLTTFIDAERVDLLLVAGDIFDTTTPANRAQELYYQFLGQISRTACRHVVITGGNHDSPTFLDAPKSILRALDIHVIGAATGNSADEILLLKDRAGVVEAIVCAVPFLRDRDVRTVEAGETTGDKSRKLLEGIASHYREVSRIASEMNSPKLRLPVIGMGHLFTRDGRTSEGDGVRELYVGTLAHVDQSSISEGFDYLALGHLHLAQVAGGCETVRYSGSPMPMSFDEAGQQKMVVTVDFSDGKPNVTEHPVPCFQELLRIGGSMEEAEARIRELAEAGSKAWLEVVVDDITAGNDVTQSLEALLDGTELEILRVKNLSRSASVPGSSGISESLETMDPSEVFARCLEAHDIPEEHREDYIQTYNELRHWMLTEDQQAK